jgi:hypothetical protein
VGYDAVPDILIAVRAGGQKQAKTRLQAQRLPQKVSQQARVDSNDKIRASVEMQFAR